MKLGIIFYSFSGSTLAAAEFLKAKAVSRNVAVELLQLKLQNEERSFLRQCSQAVLKKTPGLLSSDYNLDSYDVIAFASPVWAFTITPALRSYLEEVKTLNNKKTACFLTYGSGAGSFKALKELENILRSKEGHIIFSRIIKGSKTGDFVYMENEFKSLLEMIDSVSP